MLFNENYRKEFENEFGGPEVKINGMKIKFWLTIHKEISDYFNKLLIDEPRYIKLSSVIWAFRHNFDINKHKCETCGKLLNLKILANNRIPHYCCNKCAMNNENLKQKRKETIEKDPDYYKKIRTKIEVTSLEKYGTKVPMKSDIVKNNLKESLKNVDWDQRYEKTKKTCQEHYGVDNPSQAQEVKNKKEETCLKHYGVKSHTGVPEVLEKVRKTCLERYGVTCQFQRKEVHDKSIKYILDESWKLINTWKEYVIPEFDRKNWFGLNTSEQHIYKWKCSKCGKIFEQEFYHSHYNKVHEYLPRCPFCYPVTGCSSVAEKEISNFCKKYYPDLIENDRTLIAPLELDIVIPKLKLAIEFDGMWYHSIEAGTPLHYHLHKTELCESKGYRLIHIKESQFELDFEGVKNKLKNIFEGIEYLGHEEILDRQWFSILQFQKGTYELLPPETYQFETMHLENSGYIKRRLNG